MEKISKFSFYYITPTMLGFITGLSFRDSMTLSISKKITMSLVDYYEVVDEEMDKNIVQNFPDLQKLKIKPN